MKNNNKKLTATSHTKKENQKIIDYLDFDNKKDYEDAKKNLIAPLDFTILEDKDGEIVWDTRKTEFLDEKMPDTVNPSLWRNSYLQSVSGLFKVVDGVYQVRGLSLSTIIFIEGKEGVIVCDTLKSVESAKAAMELYYKHRPKKPVTAIIISQSHSDHFGGIQGVLEYAKDDNIPIIAPQYLADEAISEYVILGSIMQRRGQYQFGAPLTSGPQGVVSQGIGPVGTNGKNSFKVPTVDVSEKSEIMEIDGLTFEFLLTPDTEAPAEMHFYIKDYKVIYASENVNRTMHQIYTVRGAKARDTLKWIDAIERTIDLTTHNNVDALIMAHAWPVWGEKEIINHLKMQRNLYKYMHDQTIRLANHGYTMNEIAEVIKLPSNLDKYWGNRGYYGTLKHNVKGIYNFYLGYYSGHPSDLDPLAERESGEKYVSFMGGEEEVIKKAKVDYDLGEYRWVAQVLKNIIVYNPNNNEAKTLLANSYEQLGYQAESANWRNIYLLGALELREGVDRSKPPYDSSMLYESIPTDEFLKLLSVKLNGPKSEDYRMSISLEILDTEEYYTIKLEDSVLLYKKDEKIINPDFSISANQKALYRVGNGKLSIEEAQRQGEFTIKGNKEKFNEFITLFDSFDPLVDIV